MATLHSTALKAITILCMAASTRLPIATAEDCSAGERYYRQAQEATETTLKIERLRRSIEVCPTFEAWYLLGGVYLEIADNQQAGQAFQMAYGLSNSEDARALALGRSAQALAGMDRASEAIQALRTAIAKHSNPPTWMKETLRTLELTQSQRVVSAEQITRALTARSFGIRPRIDLRIHFAYDSTVLDSDGETQVQELGKALTSASLDSLRFLIIGHTDKQGDEAYNQGLSERRASTVAKELMRRFPALAARLHSEGHGERELLYPGDSEEDHRLNRRVEVRVE